MCLVGSKYGSMSMNTDVSRNATSVFRLVPSLSELTSCKIWRFLRRGGLELWASLRKSGSFANSRAYASRRGLFALTAVIAPKTKDSAH